MNRLAAALLVMLLLVGCASQREQPNNGVEKPPTESQQHISRAKAVEAASKKVDTNTLEVKEATLVEKYLVSGKELTVWQVEFQTKDQKRPQVTYFVDALTGESVWSENPPSEGARGPNASQLQQYTPVNLALTDYRGASRNLVTNPNDVVVAGVRALGQQVDYPSPPIHPTPGYELTLKGPGGQEAVLSYVGNGNWQVLSEHIAIFVEGKALVDAVQEAIPVPSRQPGDLEYLFGATELKASQNGVIEGISDALWNRRRQVVVRVLRDLGKQMDGVSVPNKEPLRLIFTVKGRAVTVEVWDDLFRYGGRVYQADQVLRNLGSSMSAG